MRDRVGANAGAVGYPGMMAKRPGGVDADVEVATLTPADGPLAFRGDVPSQSS
jgi:hypothetical protein